MTTREEEIRSLEMTRQFLIALLNKTITPKVPKEIRARASACLRHYPLTITNITSDGVLYRKQTKIKDEANFNNKQFNKGNMK